MLPNLQIFATFIVLSMKGRVPTYAYIGIGMLALETFLFNMIGFTVASFVNSKSIRVLGVLRNTCLTRGGSFCKKKELVKTLKSCRELRLYVGNNFVDRGTPLVMQSYCFSQLASLLLISHS